MNNILAGHTNSYHTYTLDEALAGIAQAGFKYVELSAVRGWTEQISLDAGAAELDEVRAKLAHYDLTPVGPQRPFGLDDRGGRAPGHAGD